MPISSEAIDKAIELNGVAVKMNQTAFMWGRRAAMDVKLVQKIVYGDDEIVEKKTENVEKNNIESILEKMISS